MSGHKWWSRDADETEHPNDSNLLAYIREQPLDQSWQNSIYQHLAHCTACQKRCKELRQTSTLLNKTLRMERRYPLSLSHAESEWDWIQSSWEAQLAYGVRRQKRQHEDMALGMAVLTRLPFVLKTKVMPVLASSVHAFMVKAKQPRTGIMVVPIKRMSVAFLMLLSVVFVLAYILVMHNPLIAVHPNVAQTRTQSAVRLTPQPTSMPTMVPTRTGEATGTSAGGSKPTIFVCAFKVDKAQGRISICGVNFKPGDKVELFITTGTGNSGAKARHAVWVDASGHFDDPWYVYSCKNVPTTIIAQDVEHPSIEATLSEVAYKGGCYPVPILTIVTVTHRH